MNTITARTGLPMTGVNEDEEPVRSVMRQSGDAAKPGGPARGRIVVTMMFVEAFDCVVCILYFFSRGRWPEEPIQSAG